MGSRVCAGYALRWEIQYFDRAGQLIWRISRDVKAGSVTETDKVAFRNGFATANRSHPADQLTANRLQDR